MRDETSANRQDRRRNGTSRARHEAGSQDVPLGEAQDEHDHDHGHGAYRCCGSRNGEVDGIRHPPEILLRTDTISPNHPLLASRKPHLRFSAAPIPVPWLLFLLTTPVFFYSGWIFLYSSFRALQHRTLNMSVLIAVGITAAYSFSVLLTILQSADSYYEAAALLVTFVLFGHWMEMRSRRGTTDALQALLQLVPP